MSLELKQAAQRAIEMLTASSTFFSTRSALMTDECRAAAEELRTAIQQAEAQQPATSDPAAWLDEMLADTREVFDAGGSETPQVVRDVIEYVKSWVTVYSDKNHPAAHPAPSVPSLIEEAISSGHFGVLPMKATTLMCKAGWAASGGELTFQQINRVYEEMYKARPLPDAAKEKP